MLHAVVMAGGSGTRFWPKSRRDKPKQLLCLFGDRTMIRQTLDRVSALIPPERSLVITGADQAEAVRRELPSLPSENIVAEPAPRDTAACVGLAALKVHRADPAGTMIVMPADHMIRPDETFRRTVEAAAEVIDHDPQSLVTFGITPTRPETGYGYIERGSKLGDPLGIGMHSVAQFREKPDRATAESFLKSGAFYWNSGIFVWRAATILEAIARHRPKLYEGLALIAKSLGTPGEAEILAAVFPTLERIPIDKAVMEKASNVRVLEVTYEWNDVGDWRALESVQAPDENGNLFQGMVHALDVKGATIIASEPGSLIAALGVEDLVIVQSGNATLVARKDKLDSLKKLVESLPEAGYGWAN